jgi:anti-sigma regulatory factor (Ser/Thr protein kinase)
VIHLSAGTDSLLLEFSSDITFVDVAVEIIRKVLEYRKIEDPTNVLLVSRELLKNAVVHGNQNDRDKKVTYRLQRSGAERFRLEVEDSGPGIYPRPAPGGAVGSKSGRGYTIIYSLAEQVRFNPQGNRVTVVLGAV